MAINTDNLETVLNTKIASATSSTPDKDLLLISKSVEALDNSIGLKPEDIGNTVQGYNADLATNASVSAAVSDLVAAAPGTLDTLNELAAALGDDPNHVTTMTEMINGKVDDGQVQTDVPLNALFTDTVYTHPDHTGDVWSTADGATVIQDDAVDLAMLSASGTASGTTFLRGDNTWATPTDTNTDTKWDGGSTGLIASTGRTSLELGTAATSAATAFETADTAISKTDEAETRTANIDLLTYTEKYITIGMDGIINLSLGTVFTHDHAHATSGNMTAFTVSSVPTTGTSGFILILENGGAYPLTWWTGSGSAAIKWPAATPPTLTAAGIDIFTFTTPDSGVTWYGIPSGIGMA